MARPTSGSKAGETGRNGYHGKILHFDLQARTSWIEEPDDEFWRIYSGGGLLATALLLRDSPPGFGAFDPSNLLVLTSSVVAGHPFAGLARFTAAAKSPLSGGIGEARAEGPFGVALKGSGVDTVVCDGRAERPVSILIEDGAVSYLEASDLWGLPVWVAVDRLAVSRAGSGRRSTRRSLGPPERSW